ncbi:MAG TPA: proline dehydrogenase [Crocinitomix sp.]|nr:proline dehydrogenase [Crocinitomix sp.]
MINFDNTQIAFGSKSNSDLKWSYRLFNLMSKPWLVKVGKVATTIAFKLHLPIKGIIKKTIFKQFCGGENIKECEQRINQLAKFNIGTILDYSVEGKTSNEDLNNVKNEIIATIKKAKSSPHIPFSVFKPTGVVRFELLELTNNPNAQLTPEIKEELATAIKRIDEICKVAYTEKVPLFIDAEDSWIQDGIDRIVNAMMAKYNKQEVIVYNTIQMYRHDRLEFLKKSHQKAIENGYKIGMKIVRGAYMEKERERAQKMGYPSPIHKNKQATDKDYNLAVEYCINHLSTISFCAGTHNEQSSAKLAQWIKEKQISKSDKRIYFAQLLGMSDHISYNLSHHGYNVAKYVPYGPIQEVMPYLIRRAEENTSVAGQTGRELSLIIKELKRRKQ